MLILRDSYGKLEDIQVYYKQIAKKFPFKRFLYKELKKQLKYPHITGISGLRGTGKTILLLQLLHELPNSFFMSLDMFTKQDLFGYIFDLNKKHNIKYLLLDEVHYLPNYATHLKQIYDVLGIKIFFTSSMSLNILGAKADLARRVEVLNLPILSLREYLHINNIANTLYKPKKLKTILQTQYKHADLELSTNFLDYLMFPLPTQIENKSPTIIENILTKIIDSDLPAIYNFDLEDRVKIKETLLFLANIPNGDISIFNLAQNMKISRYKMKIYIQALEDAFVVNTVQPAGNKVLKEPKVLLNIPFRYYLSQKNLNELLGSIKEDFFVSMLKSYGQLKSREHSSKPVINLKAKPFIQYLKTTRGKKTPDYLINIKNQSKNENIVIEIGGKKKGYTQFKDIKMTQKYLALYPFTRKPNAIPLEEFGMLY